MFHLSCQMTVEFVVMLIHILLSWRFHGSDRFIIYYCDEKCTVFKLSTDNFTLRTMTVHLHSYVNIYILYVNHGGGWQWQSSYGIPNLSVSSVQHLRMPSLEASWSERPAGCPKNLSSLGRDLSPATSTTSKRPPLRIWWSKPGPSRCGLLTKTAKLLSPVMTGSGSFSYNLLG